MRVGVDRLLCRGIRVRHAQGRSHSEQVYRSPVSALPTVHHRRDGRVNQNCRHNDCRKVTRFYFFPNLYRYNIVYMKGYQDMESVLGTVSLKTKGAMLYNNSYQPFMQNCNGTSGSPQVFDPADYIIPPQVST